MSNRPTPETDSEHLQFAMGGFTLDFCRKLERERDEANRLICATYDALTPDGCDLPPSGINSMPDKVNAILAERDEAREEIEHMKSLLLNPHAVHINFLHGKIAKLDWDKLEHIHGPHPARKERDEAREELRTAVQERHDFHWELLDAVRERNEARELLSAAQNALDAIHLEVGGWLKKLIEYK